MLKSSLQSVLRQVVKPRLFAGVLLEIGPGRNCPGLSLLPHHPDMEWIGMGFDAAEQEFIRGYARKLGVHQRIRFLSPPTPQLDLEDRSVDVVFSFGGVHAWPRPIRLLDEISRVLKEGGDFFLGDVRRDAAHWQQWCAGQLSPECRRIYQDKSQALTLDEVRLLIGQSRLDKYVVEKKGPDWWVYRPN